ncbi:hypothetical protein PFISCL1PPCAC_7774, partial [Pristionchus fissidentatus]
AKMTDMMRDMINQLMGAQRAEEEGRRLPPYDHHTVCRAFLFGCCPADILVDSRLDSLVLCRKLHEAALKGQYEREQEKRDHFFDIDTFETLGQAIRAVDSDINKIKDKLERDNKEHADSVEYMKAQKIHDLNEQIGKALAKMEELGNEGKVEESMQLSQTVEELKTKKEQLHTDLRSVGSVGQRQQLRVCDDCGAQLNLLDHETRLADHFGGKMHLGMVDIRAKYDEMKVNIEDRKKKRMESGGGGGSSGGYGSDRRDRDRERRRTPERRDRRDDRDREKRDSRDKRDRSRSRDRSRRDDRSSRGGSSRDDRRDDRRGSDSR